ncbi:type II secretion system F family protein [bacterium]|nr:type II secretion system F family protein [bacterium]
MPKYTYIARDRKGERIEGALDADDRQAVIGRLQTMGYFPIRVEDVTPKGRQGISLAALRGRVPTRHLVSFNRQLADLVGAGIPLVKALAIILAQSQDPMLREIVSDINKSVQSGDSLAQAIRRHPKAFSPLAIAMVRAGEAGGMLDDVLQRLADFAESEEELKGKVLAAMAYPSIMTLAGTVVIFIMLTVVMPKITGVYQDLGQTLPDITQLMISITDFIRGYWWIGLTILVIFLFSMARFVKTEEGRRLYDSVLLRIPVLGGVIHRRELGLFSRTLGNLLRNGVPILTALEITFEVISNRVIRLEVEKLGPAVSQGGNIAGALHGSPWFPDGILSMIAVGEETAQLDRVLLKISETCEREVDRSLKVLTSLIEPIIILVLGVVVGFIVIAMMLPIMSLDPSAE